MPGPEPHFQPDVPAEFVEQTRQVVRCRMTQRRFWQRARIVVLLDEDPQWSHAEAGRRDGADRFVVESGKWLAKCRDGQWLSTKKPLHHLLTARGFQSG